MLLFLFCCLFAHVWAYVDEQYLPTINPAWAAKYTASDTLEWAKVEVGEQIPAPGCYSHGYAENMTWIMSYEKNSTNGIAYLPTHGEQEILSGANQVMFAIAWGNCSLARAYHSIGDWENVAIYPSGKAAGGDHGSGEAKDALWVLDDTADHLDYLELFQVNVEKAEYQFKYGDSNYPNKKTKGKCYSWVDQDWEKVYCRDSFPQDGYLN